MTLNSFKDVYNDERISEIIIVDDCSSLETFNILKEQCDKLEKVKLYRNINNRDCYANKFTAVSYCSNDFCVVFDSDNCLTPEYINSIYSQEWDEKTILAPTFAKPTFDYRAFAGMTITKENINEHFEKPMFETMLNTMNFFVNVMEYLRTFDSSIDPVTSDSIYFNYLWLKRGNKFKPIEGMEYYHLVHVGSHYKNNVHRTGDFHEKVIQMIKEL